MKKAVKSLKTGAVLLIVVVAGYISLFGIKDGKAIIGTTKTVSGNVAEIYEGGSYDIVFKLVNGHTYYINRGLEHGLTIEGLRNSYLHKQLAISYVSQLGHRGGHINRIQYVDSMVYDELK